MNLEVSGLESILVGFGILLEDPIISCSPEAECLTSGCGGGGGSMEHAGVLERWPQTYDYGQSCSHLFYLRE